MTDLLSSSTSTRNSSDNNETMTNRESIISNAIQCIDNGDYGNAITMLKNIESELANDDLLLWDYRNLLGNTYFRLDDYESALSYYQMNIHTLRKNLLDSMRKMISLANIAKLYRIVGKFDLAIYYYKELSQSDNHVTMILFRKEAFTCIGDMYSTKALSLLEINNNQLTEEVKLNMYKALNSYYRGLEVFNDNPQLIELYEKISDIWYRLDEFQLCIIMNEKKLEIIKISGDKIIEFKTCRYLGDLSGMVKRYDKSIEYYRKALDIATQSDMMTERVTLIYILGNIYHLSGNSSLAVEYHNEHLQIARSMNDPQRILLALSTLSTLFNRLGLYREAKTYAGALYEKSEELSNSQEMEFAKSLITDINRNKFQADQRKRITNKGR